MLLTDIACRNAKPKSKIYRITDGDGLFLEIHPKGQKYWRYRYTRFDKDRILSIGGYPGISLMDARVQQKEAKKQIKNNVDPLIKKQQNKLLAKYQNAQTFEPLVREWHKHFSDKWEEKTATVILRRFEIYLFPHIGSFPYEEVTSLVLLACLQKTEKHSRDIANRLLKHCYKVFNYANRTGRPNDNPTIGLEDELKKYKRGHFAAIDINKLPDLLDAIRCNKKRLYRETVLAIRLLMLTAVRTKELMHAKKTEFRFNDMQWIIPAERMKMKQDHIVPLSRQAVIIINELIELSGKSEYLLPSKHSYKNPMSRCTVLRAIDRIGFKGDMTGHGFRTVFLGISKEKLRYKHDIPDRQLAHQPVGRNGGAYDRAELLEERTELMQEFADYIEAVENKQPYERNKLDQHRGHSTLPAFTFNITGYNTTFEYKLSSPTKALDARAFPETTQRPRKPNEFLVER